MTELAMSRKMLFFALLSACCLSTGAVGQTPVIGDHAYGPDPEQRYDLYPAKRGEAPLIMMVHGGGWARGDKSRGRVVDNKLKHWLPQGIAFATTNYRMQPKAPPLEQARDVARALANIQQNSSFFGVDRGNIILIGHSAGAHLIALLATRPELLNDAGAKSPRAYILLDSGALDVPAIMKSRHLPLYDRAFGNDPADWTAASPYHQLRKATAPMLIVCSTRRANACPQGRSFAAKANDLGGQVEVLPSDKSHGEINAQLGEDAAYTAQVERFMRGNSAAFAARLGG